MGNSQKNKPYFFVWKRYIWSIVAVWTLVISASLMWNLIQIKQNSLKVAYIQARTAYERDVMYRRWSAGHGGVYVPVTEETQPNPNLSHIPDRDIKTPSDILLTLMNPAYMSRQVFELSESELAIRGHITSLNPIRTENSPDFWESQALKAFEDGQNEIFSIERLDDKDYIRFMSSLITEQACLKCHALQGYQVGDIRGGISISIPFDPIEAMAHTHIFQTVLGHILIWFLGLGGITLAMIRLNQKESLRRVAEETLKQREELLAHTQAISRMGSWSLDIEKNKLVWSDEVYRIFGLQPQEFEATYEAFLEAVHPDDRVLVDNAYKMAIDKKEPYEVIHRILCPNGEVRTVHEKSIDIVDETGKPIHSIGMVHDITERIQAEEALRQATSLETLTSVLENFISDSLSNLLTPIYGRIELSESRDNLEQIKAELGSMKEGMTKLIAGLNVFRKFSGPGKDSLGRIGTVDIRSLLKAMLSGTFLRTYLGEKFAVDQKIKMKFLYDPEQKGNLSLEELPSVSGNQMTILTALQETLINAVESYDPQRSGDILLSAEKSVEDLIIKIVDTGRGMSEEEKEKSQLPFYKILGVKTSTRFGLGAFVAKECANYCDGDIHIKSKEGEGTTVSIVLKISP